MTMNKIDDRRAASPRDAREEAHSPTTRDDDRFAEREKAAIENKTPISPPAVFEVIRRAGQQELDRPASALVASALAAGLAIGFSVLAQAILRSHLPDTQWRPLLESVGYSA